jgi:hypothetical protein
MSRIGALLMAASMMAAAAESNYGGGSVRMHKNHLYCEPEWKRKKCKSCVSCNSICNGKWSKPTQNACERYKKK